MRARRAGALAPRARGELPARLRACLPELQDAIAARMRWVADPGEVGDADYVQGLRQAARAALEHAIGSLEGAPSAEQALPVELARQARLAARRGVALETVVRRYVGGHALLCQFLMREAGEAPASALEDALRTQAALLDRTLAEVCEAYREEAGRGQRTAERRRAERVRRLLAGEPVQGTELGYELDLWHLGAIAAGPGGDRALRALAAALDRQLLLVRSGRGEAWAWLGGRRALAAERLAERAGAVCGPDLALAIGEPGRGLAAWRLTHRQAKLALPVARRGPEPTVTYSDVALIAAALGDDVLAASLTQRYLAPLQAERDGGAALRETLRAYFEAERNVSSAAAALGVKRHTVTNRLRVVEQRLGSSPDSCAAELQMALRLRELGVADV